MRVLYVSKPLAAPFHDGSLCLVRDVACQLREHQGSVMTVAGAEPWPDSPGLPRCLPVYRQKGRFAPGLIGNATVARHLLTERDSDLWHVVFAPNPRSSGVLLALRRARGIPIVQTVASPPRDFASRRLLFGDVVVAQSRWTQQRLAAEYPRHRIEVIPPPLVSPEPATADQVQAVRQRLGLDEHAVVVCYPGDLEFSRGAQRVRKLLAPLLARIGSRLVVVYACRRKTEQAARVEASLVSAMNSRHVRFAGELPSLLPLLQLSNVVVFPVEDLWAKVDIPIALLEAMALGTPVIVPDAGPLSELDAPIRVAADATPQWVDAITALAFAGSIRSESITRQRDSIRQQFDAARVAARYEQLYSDVCSDHRWPLGPGPRLRH